MKGFKEPILISETHFTKWQEVARKEIERAFGVLQGKFQFTARPIHLFKMNDICLRMATCIVLHNMCVSDRIMEDCWEEYDPATIIETMTGEIEVDTNEDADDNHNVIENHQGNTTGVGIANAPTAVANMITNSDRFNELTNRDEHARLMKALIRSKSRF